MKPNEKAKFPNELSKLRIGIVLLREETLVFFQQIKGVTNGNST